MPSSCRSACFIIKSTFFNRKSGFLNKKSGFFHWKLTSARWSVLSPSALNRSTVQPSPKVFPGRQTFVAALANATSISPHYLSMNDLLMHLFLHRTCRVHQFQCTIPRFLMQVSSCLIQNSYIMQNSSFSHMPTKNSRPISPDLYTNDDHSIENHHFSRQGWLHFLVKNGFIHIHKCKTEISPRLH